MHSLQVQQVRQLVGRLAVVSLTVDVRLSELEKQTHQLRVVGLHGAMQDSFAGLTFLQWTNCKLNHHGDILNYG